MHHDRTLYLVGTTLSVLALSGAAQAQTQVLTIQPIQVCDNSGAHCAPVNVPLTIMNTIYAQAGTVIGVAPTKQLNRSDFLVVDTVANSISPTDEARVLMRGPHLSALGVSPQSTTLNVFFVDDLREVDLTSALTALGSGLAGHGFINSNGIIVDASARIDTLAHEIAHNLGLGHVAAAQNLLAPGDVRRIPSETSQIAPNGTLSALSPAQIAEIRNPLYAVNLARVRATPPSPPDIGPGCGHSALPNCLEFRFEASPNNEKLRAVKLNFLPGSDVRGFSAAGAVLIGPGLFDLTNLGPPDTLTLADGTVQVRFTFTDVGGFQDGIAQSDFAQFTTPYGRQSTSDPATDPALPFPLSVFYEFSSGIGTTGLFDAVTGGASDEPFLVEIAAPAPPSPDVPLEILLSDGEVADVSAPGTIVLLASAIVALARWRRPRARAPEITVIERRNDSASTAQSAIGAVG